VLRVAKLGIKQGETNGAEYYLRTMAQNLDQYYSGQGEAPGVWLGSGVAAIAAERGFPFADGQTLDQNGAEFLRWLHSHEVESIFPAARKRLDEHGKLLENRS